ncbi:MAG TPA: tetratricopeptide repeat protein [Planctomycetota bacterium]
MPTPCAKRCDRGLQTADCGLTDARTPLPFARSSDLRITASPCLRVSRFAPSPRRPVPPSVWILLAALLSLSGCRKEVGVAEDPKKSIEAGWTFFAVSEFDRAEAAFNKAVAAAPAGSQDNLFARFGLANAYQHRTPTAKLEEAKKAYAELVEADKAGEIGGWSCLALARIEHLKLYDVQRTGGASETTTGEQLFIVALLLSALLAIGSAYLLKENYRLTAFALLIVIMVVGLKAANWVRAYPFGAGTAAAAAQKPKQTTNLPSEAELAAVRVLYQRVIEQFPKAQAAEEAAVFFGQTMIETLSESRAKEGVAYLTRWIEQHPGSNYASPAYAQLAVAYELLQQPREQLAALLKADETNRDPIGDRSIAYYRIGFVAEKVGEKTTAEKYYKLLIEKYPTDFHLFSCKQGLKRMGVLPASVPTAKEAAR